jgi:L-ascorbate metabolism protein UlaG (beta-lactamase superfamily)
MTTSARFVWLGQSGFLIDVGGTHVLVDAFLAPHPGRRVVSEVPPGAASSLDVIACTHEHLDHLDKDCVPKLAASSPGARVVVPEPIVDMVTELGVPRDRVVGMQPDRPVDVAGMRIQALPAMHAVHPSDGYSFGQEMSGGMYRFLGFVFQRGDVSIYHAGDTIPYDGLARRLRELAVDVALLPINGRDGAREALDIAGNLDAEEAARLAIEAAVDVVVPMHYDMFIANPGDPARLVEAVQRAGGGVSVLVPARGRPFVYSRP